MNCLLLPAGVRISLLISSVFVLLIGSLAYLVSREAGYLPHLLVFWFVDGGRWLESLRGRSLWAIPASIYNYKHQEIPCHCQLLGGFSFISQPTDRLAGIITSGGNRGAFECLVLFGLPSLCHLSSKCLHKVKFCFGFRIGRKPEEQSSPKWRFQKCFFKCL